MHKVHEWKLLVIMLPALDLFNKLLHISQSTMYQKLISDSVLRR